MSEETVQAAEGAEEVGDEAALASGADRATRHRPRAPATKINRDQCLAMTSLGRSSSASDRKISSVCASR